MDAALFSLRCGSGPRRRSRFNQVQAALGLGESRPASRARVLSGPDRACAMRAADARIVLVVQLVVGHLIVVDVTPHLLRRPIHDGIDLYQSKLRIPLDALRA